MSSNAAGKKLVSSAYSTSPNKTERTAFWEEHLHILPEPMASLFDGSNVDPSGKMVLSRDEIEMFANDIVRRIVSFFFFFN